MTRILVISQHYPPEKSGNASRIHDMSTHLSQLGCNVQILAPHPTFPVGCFSRKWKVSSKSAIEGITLTNLWSWQPSKNDPSFFFSRLGYYLIFPVHVTVWLFFNYRTFDIIITSSPPLFTHIPGMIAKLVFKKKWVMDVRDLWIDASIGLGFVKKGSLSEKISRKFEYECLCRTDIISVTTKELGNRLSHDPCIQQKIHVIPNGVDTTNFTMVGNIPKKKQIIYAGNVGYAQDLETVILAMKEITKKHPLQFIIAGDGDILSDLRTLVHKENLDRVVIFTGPLPRNQIPTMIKESLIGIAPLKDIPSLEYAAPTKVYEYMAGEIPFLGCGHGEIETIARESNAGIIAENTPDSIAEAIIMLLDDPERMYEMGMCGRVYVEKNYSRKDIAGLLKGYIEGLV